MSQLSEKYKSVFIEYGIVTKLRHDHLMAQMYHESKFSTNREDGHYKTISRLRLIFSTPFKKKTDLFVKSFLFDAVKLFNYVYANRNGNGSFESGDGYKFRAGGFLGLTGRSNYQRASNDLGIDYVKNPDKICNEADSLLTALWYWKVNNLNKYADRDDLDSISDIINIGRPTKKYGDSNDFKKRKEAYEKYKAMDYSSPK